MRTRAAPLVLRARYSAAPYMCARARATPPPAVLVIYWPLVRARAYAHYSAGARCAHCAPRTAQRAFTAAALPPLRIAFARTVRAFLCSAACCCCFACTYCACFLFAHAARIPPLRALRCLPHYCVHSARAPRMRARFAARTLRALLHARAVRAPLRSVRAAHCTAVLLVLSTTRTRAWLVCTCVRAVARCCAPFLRFAPPRALARCLRCALL